MKKHFHILAIILMSLIAYQSKASHLVGSDITYQCTSTPNVYKITMKIYRDCAGIPLCPGCSNTIPTGTVSGCTTASSGWSTQILGVTTGCTGVNYGAFTLNAISATSGYDIIQTCTSVYTICTNCNTRNAGTFSPGIEVYTYEGNVNLSSLPTSCCRVLLGANTCCRNGALTTIVPGSFQTVCEIDRCQSSCNSAPTFTNDAAAIVCAGVDFVYNLGAMDPDGDSLSYAFGPSLQGIGSNVSYVPPYNAGYPFPYFGAPNAGAAYPAGLRIDPLTGDVLFRPLSVFVSNLVIEVTQWKLVSGVRVNVGMTRRDVQFQTQLCTNNRIPRIKAYKNSILQSGLSFSVQAGQPICIDIVAEDQFDLTTTPPINADTTDMKWNNPSLYISAMANATFTRNYILSTRGINGPKADSFKFCWTPSLTAIRSEPYLFTVTGADRFCPVRAFATRGITIKVESPKTVTIDNTTKSIYCNNKVTSTNVFYRTSLINLLSGNVFTVQLSDSSGSFTNATTIGTKLATDTIGFIPINIPTGLFLNRNYKIRVNASSDTVNLGTAYTINLVAGFSTPVITNNRDSFCKGLISTFKVTPNTSGLTFKWLKNNAIIVNETKDSLLIDSAYTYRAIVSNTGCSDTSNAKYLNVYPKPIVNFTAPVYVCLGNGNAVVSLTNSSTLSTGTMSHNWKFSDNTISNLLNPTKTVIDTGNLVIKLISTSNNGCADSVTKIIKVNSSPTIGTITGNAAPNSITAPFAYSVLNQANSTYSWSASNGTIQSGQGTNAVNIIWPSTGTGNLIAKITNNNSCADSTNLLVNITSVGVKEINTNPFSQINFKPNPFTNELEISFTSKTKELTKLVIIDAVGKEVFVKTIPSNIGNNTFIIDEMAHLKSGVYFAHLANNNGMSQSIKLVKE